MSGERRPPALLNFAIVDLPRAAFVERMRFHLDRWPAIIYSMTSTSNDWQTFFAENGELYGFNRGVQMFVFEAGSDRSAYVCNIADGWHSLIWNVAREGHSAVYFRTTMLASVPFGVHEMEVWSKGEVSRHVRSLQEERGWQFLNNGTPLNFERTEDFRRRRIKDRFNLSHIEAYCPEFGIRLNDVYSCPGAGTLFQTAPINSYH